VVISLLLPLVTLNQGRRDPKIQAEIDRTITVTPSAVERFGLFTIIVLGEVVAAVVRGVAGLHDLTWLAGITAGLGMLIGIGLWWVYFDFIAHPGTRANLSRGKQGRFSFELFVVASRFHQLERRTTACVSESAHARPGVLWLQGMGSAA
jgi:low temperature requirement protein LtrA